MHLRIGIANAKELEIIVEDPEAVVRAYRGALDAGDDLMTIESRDGAEVVLHVPSVVYIAGEPPTRGSIGFSAAAAEAS